jgi:hypothetical protein
MNPTVSDPNGDYKDITLENIKDKFSEMFYGKEGPSGPDDNRKRMPGVYDLGNGLYEIFNGERSLYTGEGGVAEYNKAIKKEANTILNNMSPTVVSQEAFNAGIDIEAMKREFERKEYGLQKNIKSSKGKFPSNRQPKKKKRK